MISSQIILRGRCSDPSIAFYTSVLLILRWRQRKRKALQRSSSPRSSFFLGKQGGRGKHRILSPVLGQRKGPILSRRRWRAETIEGSEERKEERNRRSYLTVSPGQGRHIQYLIIAPTRKDVVFLSFRRLLLDLFVTLLPPTPLSKGIQFKGLRRTVFPEIIEQTKPKKCYLLCNEKLKKSKCNKLKEQSFQLIFIYLKKGRRI